MIARSAASSLEKNWPGDEAVIVRAVNDRPGTSLPFDNDEQPVMVLSFHMTLGRNIGWMRLYIPSSILVFFAPHETSNPTNRSTVELSVSLPKVVLTSHEWHDLVIGDILVTDTSCDGEVVVRLAGIIKFTARLGSWGSYRAVMIRGKVPVKDPIRMEPGWVGSHGL
jgi:flagellar motor switch protein FliM